MATLKEQDELIKRNNLIQQIERQKNDLKSNFKLKKFAEEERLLLSRENQARTYGRNADEENKIDELLNKYYEEKDPSIRRIILNSLPPTLSLQLRNEEMKQNMIRKDKPAVTSLFDVDNFLVNEQYDFSRLTRMAEKGDQNDEEYE